MARHLPRKDRGLAARAHELVDRGQGPAHVARGQRVRKGEARRAPGRAQRVLHDGGGDVVLRIAHAQVQQADRVAHAALGRAGDVQQRLVLGLAVLLLADAGELGRDVLCADALEVVALAAGQDGRRQLLRVGRGQDEDRVLRRLLQGLEQRVERGGRGRQRVHLVDDDHAVAAGLRGIGDLGAQVAHLVHAAVGGRVDLQDIQVVLLGERLAGRTDPAGLAVLRIFTVDGPREDARGRGLARPARAVEQIGVRDAAGLDLVLERLHDRPLAHHVAEAVRAKGAVQRRVFFRHVLFPPWESALGRSRA